ncbi:MAG: ADP-ribosyltransferase [Bdellovibrionota bacterium]
MIRLIPAAECVSTLQSDILTISPIRAGINTIAALNENNGQSRTRSSCLDEALADWRKTSVPEVWREPGKGKPQLYTFVYDTSALEALDRIMQCFDSANPVDPSCNGHLTTAAEYSRAEEEKEFETHKRNKAQDEWQTKQDLLAGMFQILFPATPPDKGLTEAAWAAKRDEFKKFWYDPENELSAQVEQALPPMKRAICYNPGRAGEPSVESYRQEHQRDCEGAWISKEDAAKLSSQISSLFPDIEAKKAKWEILKESQGIERRRQIYELNKDLVETYNQRRLLAYYSSYLKSGGDAGALAEFCGQYERLQRRDKDYAVLGRHPVHLLESDADWKFAEQFGLTEAEIAAVDEYTASYFADINSALREGKPLTPQLALFKEVLDKALERLPAYSSSPVTRMASLPPEALKEHVPGAVLTYQAYTSTTKSKTFQSGGDQLFTIYGVKTGRLVSDLAKMTEEEEVLFPAGTRFKVLYETPVLMKDRSGKEMKILNIVMAEVDKDGKLAGTFPPKVREKAAAAGVKLPK